MDRLAPILKYGTIISTVVSVITSITATAILLLRNRSQTANETSVTKQHKFVHKHVACAHCKAEPIVGIRYKCVNCPSYDLCEECEQQALVHHDRTHLFIKIRIPIPALILPHKPLLDVYYPGANKWGEPEGDCPDKLVIPPQEFKRLKSVTRYSDEELQALYLVFKNLSRNDVISRSTFASFFGEASKGHDLIISRMFSFFDQDNSGYIDFTEMVTGLWLLTNGTPEQKAYFAFKGFDLDDDGFVTEEDLRIMFSAFFKFAHELARESLLIHEFTWIKTFDASSGEPVSKHFASIAPQLPLFSGGNAQSSDQAPSGNASTVVSNANGNVPESRPQSANTTQEVQGEGTVGTVNKNLVDVVHNTVVDYLVNTMMQQMDTHGMGKVSIQAFTSYAVKQPHLLFLLDFMNTLF